MGSVSSPEADYLVLEQGKMVAGLSFAKNKSFQSRLLRNAQRAMFRKKRAMDPCLAASGIQKKGPWIGAQQRRAAKKGPWICA